MTLLILAACCSAALAFGCAFAFIGLVIATRIAPKARASEALLDTFLIAVAIALAAIEGLGFARVLTPGALGALCAFGCALAWRSAGPQALRALGAHLLAARAALRASPWSWPWLGLAVLLACRGLVRVPLAWDAIGYHLTYAAHWIRQHGFVPFEAGGVWEQYESFPKAGEALFWLAMAPFHGDALVNLANLPFWFGIALAFRCAALRLGASARAAEAWLLPLLVHPMLSAYVTPAYVELQSAFYLLAALALGLRAHADLRAVPLLLLAVCLAIATKMTSLAWLLPLALYGVVLARRHGLAPLLRVVGNPVCLLGVAVALPWYVNNALRCDNPLYPAALPFATSGPAAGSLAMARTLASSSIAHLGNYDALLALLLEPPWTVKYPLGPGALFPWIWLALPLLLPFVRDRGQRVRALVIWAGAWFLLLIYFLSPHNGEFLDTNSRFLALPCMLGALALAAVHDNAARGPRRVALIGTLAIAALALWPTQLWRMPRWAPVSEHPAAWIVALVLLAAGATSLRSRASRRTAFVLAGLLLGCGLAASAALLERERDRAIDLASAIDLHPVSSTPLSVELLHIGPARIAFAVGGYSSFEGWFFYPLFGARIEHDVEYVDVERTATPACRRRGRVRDQPDAQAWLARIEAHGITHLFATGAPLEATWAHAHPERFRLLKADATGELFRIVPRKP